MADPLFRAIHFGASLLPLLACVFLAGCSTVGVTSIEDGRTPYNDVIQDTSREQTFLNILRVKDGESPLFMDVTEVDQATTVSGSITGGAMGIGARANAATTQGTIAGTVGTLSGMAGYQEAPTVRYVPLSGQALIAQVSTPITPESIANLTNSDWPLAAVLTFSIDRLTPGYLDYDAAVNAIADLQEYGALIIAATQSSEARNGATIRGLTFSTAPPPTKDSLTLYLEDDHLAKARASCDGTAGTDEDAKRVVRALWRRLTRIYHNQGAKVISIKSKGSAALENGKPDIPYLNTRSALGLLKAASEQDAAPTIQVLPEEEVRRLMSEKDHEPPECSTEFYTLDPASHPVTDYEKGSNALEYQRRVGAVHGQLLSGKPPITMYPLADDLSPEQLRTEELLVNARKFMLVAKSDRRPADAFVAIPKGDGWYSILNADKISKRSLALINQFTTIQAIPSPTQPLTPTISVGAR